MNINLSNILFVWAVRELDNPVEHGNQIANSPRLLAAKVTLEAIAQSGQDTNFLERYKLHMQPYGPSN